VIGLDGANWDLLGPWLKDGELPNLALLREEGSWGVSLAQLPAVTCPNWRCYSTGKNPGKLGVYWWKMLDKKARRLRGFDAKTFKSADYFDYLAERMRVGVLNFPTSYPPKRTCGFWIAGPPDAAETGYAEPPEMEVRLREEFGYRVHPRIPLQTQEDDNKEAIAGILDLIGTRFRVAEALLDEVDFLQLSIYYSNNLQHFLFDHPATLAAWRIIDRYLGIFRARPDLRIVLMSDHGIGKVSATFHINRWLEEEGLLSLIPGAHWSRRLAAVKPFGFNPRGLLKDFFEARGLKERLRHTLPRALSSLLFLSESPLSPIPLEIVDWEKSRAIGLGQGVVYILRDKDDEEYYRVRSRVKEGLTSLKNPVSGQPVARGVYAREEVYRGPYLDFAPDLVFEQAHDLYTVASYNPTAFSLPTRWRAENVREGIFLAAGEGIHPGPCPGPINIIDLAPTIMHWLGMEIPEDMDGRVVGELFEAGSEPAARTVRKREPIRVDPAVASPSEQAELTQRLESLGYL